MNCPDEETLIAYLDGDLSGKQAEKMNDHLGDCSACRSEHARIENLMDTLHRPDRVDVDPTFVQRVTNEVDYIASTEKESTSNRRSRTGLRPFIRRNASWVASLSLHFSLVFLVGFLVVSEFPGSEPAFSGIPVMKNRQPDLQRKRVRNNVLWRGAFRRLRTTARDGTSGCALDPAHRKSLKRAHRLLLEEQRENGTWGRSGSSPGRTIRDTSLALLALLRSTDLTTVEPASLNERIRSGLSALTDRQAASGRIGSGDLRPSVHAVATAALLEASLLHGWPGQTRHALNALRYLLDRTSTDEQLNESGYWTWISFRLGTALGSRTARRRLMERETMSEQNQSSSIAPSAILVRGLLSDGPLPDRDQNDLIQRIRAWRNKRTGPNKHPLSAVMDDPAALLISSSAYFARGDADQTWSDILRRIRPLGHSGKIENRSPGSLARYILVFRTCRSYPR